MNWLNNLMVSSIMQLFSFMLEGISDVIENIFGTMNNIMDKIQFNTLEEYTSKIALALVVLFAIKQGIMVYVFHIDGDPDSDALELLTRFAITICIILCGPWLIHKLTEIAAIFCEEVNSIVAEFSNDSMSFMERLQRGLDSLGGQLNGSSYVLPMLILFLAAIVMMCAFVVKAAKRSVEVVLFGIMTPLFALDLLTTNREKWTNFFTEAMVCIFGYILQVFCYSVFMGLMRQTCMNITMESLLVCVCWLMLCLGAPKWLQKFTYSSGVGNALKGGARSAMMYIPRMVGKR